MTTHLVLGGSGFVGRHVVAALARQGHTIVVADRGPLPPLPADCASARVNFLELDLLRQDWTGLIAACDVVHHYAWSSLPQTANEDPLEDLDTNLRGTVRLLEAMRHYPGKCLLFSSSGGTVYGRVTQSPVSENQALDPVSAYGVAKLAAEKYLGFYRAQYGVDARIARIANPFGVAPRGRTQGAVQIFLAQALAKEAITIWGDGSVVRDYLYVLDVADALTRLAAASLEGAVSIPVFNIASGEGRSLNQIVAAIGRLLGQMPAVVYRQARPFDVPVNILDITRAKTVLGWSPELSFEKGLSLVLADMKAGRAFYSTRG